MKVHVLETVEARGVTNRLDGMEIPMEESASGWVWYASAAVDDPSLADETPVQARAGRAPEHRRQSLCSPLTTAMRRLGAIGFGSLRTSAFGDPIWSFSARSPNWSQSR